MNAKTNDFSIVCNMFSYSLLEDICWITKSSEPVHRLIQKSCRVRRTKMWHLKFSLQKILFPRLTPPNFASNWRLPAYKFIAYPRSWPKERQKIGNATSEKKLYIWNQKCLYPSQVPWLTVLIWFMKTGSKTQDKLSCSTNTRIAFHQCWFHGIAVDPF